MIVCHCRQVSDRAIRACIREGACNEEHIAEMCGAGTSCGGCAPTVSEIIDQELSARGQRRLPVIVFEPDTADAAE